MEFGFWSLRYNVSMDLSDFQTNVPLAPYTTLKIGGPAEYLKIVTKQSELFDILKFVSKQIEDW